MNQPKEIKQALQLRMPKNIVTEIKVRCLREGTSPSKLFERLFVDYMKKMGMTF